LAKKQVRIPEAKTNAEEYKLEDVASLFPKQQLDTKIKDKT
jgi:hypothetical protein